jgi:hypothetical protein
MGGLLAPLVLGLDLVESERGFEGLPDLFDIEERALGAPNWTRISSW